MSAVSVIYLISNRVPETCGKSAGIIWMLNKMLPVNHVKDAQMAYKVLLNRGLTVKQKKLGCIVYVK